MLNNKISTLLRSRDDIAALLIHYGAEWDVKHFTYAQHHNLSHVLAEMKPLVNPFRSRKEAMHRSL